MDKNEVEEERKHFLFLLLNTLHKYTFPFIGKVFSFISFSFIIFSFISSINPLVNQ